MLRRFPAKVVAAAVVAQPDPLQPGISPAEKAARAAHYITGTAHPDPGWTGKLTFAKQHDRFMDSNQGALKNETFTLVGYGVDIGDKKAQIVNQQRRSTTSFLKAVQREVITFQINPNDSKAGGGSCFGDSGGGVFWKQYVLGDASYVNSLTCNATGSYQRDDTPYSRAFLSTFIG